jgi:hypothetical protein
MLSRHSTDVNFKIYYKQYCKVLTKVIYAAKKLHYNKIICNSKNKMKSTWNIINEERGKPKQGTDFQSLLMDINVETNLSKIADNFNKYFTSVADSINLDNNNNNNKNVNSKINYPSQYLVNSFR